MANDALGAIYKKLKPISEIYSENFLYSIYAVTKIQKEEEGKTQKVPGTWLRT